MEVLTTLSAKEFNSLCRFCAKKQMNLMPIFKEENNGGFDFTNSLIDENGIANMLNLCIGLETSPTDGLPLFICSDCYQKLLDSYSFRNQCIDSVDRLLKVRQNLNNVKTEDAESNDQNQTFFSDTFGDDDGWDHEQDDQEIYEERKIDNCRVVVEPLPVADQSSSKRRSTTKRKPPAKRTSKVAVKRKTKIEDTVVTNNTNIEEGLTTTISLTAEILTVDTKPEIDPVTGEIITTTSLSTDVQEIKQKRKRDRTKGPKVKKEKKPYVRKPNKPEQCDVCGFISRSLKSHMLVHTQERNFECDFCGKKFALRASLKNHIFAHINIRKFKCKICPLTFIETTQLRRHELIHRPADPDSMKWSCDICGKRFRQNNTMRTHRLSHSEARKVHCEYCDATFVTKNGYRSHVGVHTGERPYSCGFCPMTFINTSSAAVHRRIHAVNGLYECRICFHGFKTVNFLKCHMKVHFEAIAGPVRNNEVK